MSRTLDSSPDPLRVFVVEDHDDTRELLCVWLQERGHAVLAARNMRDALAAIPHSRCDVLISDIELPDGTGWELLRRLHTQRPRLAIAMSGLGTAADLANSKAAGFHHHLIKPLGTGQIARILEQAAEYRVGTPAAETISA